MFQRQFQKAPGATYPGDSVDSIRRFGKISVGCGVEKAESRSCKPDFTVEKVNWGLFRVSSGLSTYNLLI